MHDFSPKAILFDIDGTLTNSSGVISPATVTMLKKLSARGIPFCACTGRHFSTLQNFILPHFPATATHIACGGGQVITATGQVLWEVVIDPTVTEEIITTIERLGGAVAFGHDTTLYLSESLYSKSKYDNWKIPTQKISGAKNWSIPLINVQNINDEIRAYCNSLTELSVILMGTEHEHQYFDITAPGINKATAAGVWAERNGIFLSEVMFCGDGANDYPLFLVAGYSVALGQADALLQSVASVVTEPSDQDGLARFLTDFLQL